MSGAAVTGIPAGGFVFDNCRRNAILEKSGLVLPKTKKTGTTIAGVIFKDGVVLGADTRATEGSIVADKNSQKVHYLNPNIYCCGAGTAADLHMTMRMISSQLELHRLATGRAVPVVVACTLIKQMLFKYQGQVGCALVLGGVDRNGPHLYCIYPHGSTDSLPFTTMGSGSLAAMAVFESRWKENMELEDAKQLVRDAIASGIFNDLGSGSNIDLCVITKDKVDYLRPYDIANLKGTRQGNYTYQKGATAVLETRVIPIDIEQTIVKRTEDGEAMDTTA